MAYQRQEFVNNETVLTAEHLDRIEQGIVDNETEINKKQPKGDYVTTADLQTATDNALAQAKSSGEFDGEDGQDGQDGSDGSDGVGIKSIVRTAGNGSAGTTDTYTITLTDNSTYTFTVYNGANGQDGADGVSPTVSTSKSNGVTTISITDKNGTKTAKINDGTSVKVSSITETEIDGKVVSNTVTFSDGTGFTINNGEDGISAYEVALNNGFSGSEEEWLLSLQSANPIVLNKLKYPTEAEAIEYMNSQADKTITYVWNNKMYCYTSMESFALVGACLYKYRNSSSSGIVVAEGRSLLIIPVASFTAPITIDFSPYAISASAHIYGGTSPTSLPTTLIADDTYVGRTAPVVISDLKGCSYVGFAIVTTSQPASFEITVNDTPMTMNIITTSSQIESALASGSVTVEGYADSGVIYTEIVGQSSCQKYIDDRETYIFPVPSGYCESKVEYNTNGTHYLNKYNFTTMTGMFTALATNHSGYVTETLLGKDASGTYDINSYVLDAPTTISSGYASAMNRKKPTFIITAGLHGVEPDAVHEVYHFMKDLCENYMESEHLEYLRNNVRFVIVPLSNPWGYVNQSYYNSNNVDLNKNFEHGYRTNGTDNTGANAYSEAETVLLKGVFDENKDAIFHLECHGKYGEDTSISQTIWFSLMRSLNSELIELCSDTITKQIGRRTYKLGYNANKSVGGYITYYGTNGRPKDYTGTEYGMLSCTMEGTGKLYGTSGYAVDTQKINCEALENFVLRVLDALNSRVEI